MESDGDEFLVLNVDATENEVEGSLGSTVGADGPRNVLGAGNGGNAGGDDGELGLLCGLQQRQNGLEEPDRTVDVDVDVLGQVRSLGLGDLEESFGFEDAGVGDDNVKMGDALVLDACDGVCCVGLRGAVDLDCDELGALSLGDVDKVLGVLANRVASSSHDGSVGPGKVFFDEATAETLRIQD